MSNLVDAGNKSSSKKSFGKSVEVLLGIQLCLYGRCTKKSTCNLPQCVRCIKNNSMPGARMVAELGKGSRAMVLQGD